MLQSKCLKMRLLRCMFWQCGYLHPNFSRAFREMHVLYNKVLLVQQVQLSALNHLHFGHTSSVTWPLGLTYLVTYRPRWRIRTKRKWFYDLCHANLCHAWCYAIAMEHTGWSQKVSYCILSICLLNIDQFSQFFTSKLRKNLTSPLKHCTVINSYTWNDLLSLVRR